MKYERGLIPRIDTYPNVDQVLNIGIQIGQAINEQVRSSSPHIKEWHREKAKELYEEAQIAKDNYRLVKVFRWRSICRRIMQFVNRVGVGPFLK